MTLGLDEVASRAAKIAAMGPADLEALLKKKPIPYVLGPGKQIYIVDHHHLAFDRCSLAMRCGCLNPIETCAADCGRPCFRP
jgi:hypothetical protein